MSESKNYLPTYKGCIVCGQKNVNPNTLNLRFRIADGGVEVPYTPDLKHEGFKGIVHGGILCSLLDEIMGWAAAVDRKRYFVTAELNVRFLRPLMVGTSVVVRGRVIEHKFRHSTAEGEIFDESGNVYARATGKFVIMSEDQARVVHDYLTIREDDTDFINQGVPGS